MNKERIKTLLLSALIISSIVLSMQIWFNKKLWSSGYDFFSVFKDNFPSVFNKEESTLNIGDTGALDSIFAPKTILLSNVNGRAMFDSTTDEGKEIILILNELIRSSLSSNTISPVSEQDFKETIKLKNIYADYYVPVSINSIGSFLEAEQTTASDFVSFDKILVDCEKISTSIIPVYFRDSENNLHFRVNTPYDKAKLDTLFENQANTDLNLAYSFELGLDKKAHGAGNEHQNIFLDSYVLLSLDEMPMNSITEEKTDITSEDNSEKILRVLGYNPNTVRRFTQTDGTVNFVDSKSTLVISPKGYIEYTPANENSGIKIGNDNNITTAAAGSASLIDKILGSFIINPRTKLFISSPLTNEETTEHTLTFNYLYNSDLIRSEDRDCVVKVKNSRITYLKLYIKSFKETRHNDPTNVLDVIEEIYKISGYKNNLVIKTLSTSYAQYGHLYNKVWVATTSEANEPFIID